MIGEGFYLQASVEFIRTCLRRKVTQYDSRGGALTCSNTQADAQFSSKLHVLHPGNCLRRNCIVKKKVTLCLLMAFILYHDVKWIGSKTYSSDENAARGYLQLPTAQTWQQRSWCLCYISVSTSHFSQRRTVPVSRHLRSVITLPFVAVTKLWLRSCPSSTAVSQQLSIRRGSVSRHNTRREWSEDFGLPPLRNQFCTHVVCE